MASRIYSAFTREQSVESLVQPGARRFMIFAGALLLIMGGAVLRTHFIGGGAPGRGSVDTVTFEPGSRKVIITGWAGSLRHDAGLASVAIYFGDEELYSSQPEAAERPDVASAMKKPEWLNSGWRLSALVPESMEKGRYPVKARALLEDGGEFDLSTVESTKEIEIP